MKRNQPLRTVRPIYRTGVPLPSRCCILYIYIFSTTIVLSILNMLHTLRFSLQNALYFITVPFFGSCIIHILHTGCAKI